MTRIRFEDLPSTNTPINAENLNKLNNVIVSSEEPTTGEEVWIQKYDNLVNRIEENSINTETGEIQYFGGYMITSDYIEVEPSTLYKAIYTLINESKGQIVVYEYDENKTYLGFSFDDDTSYKFRTKSNTKYLKIRYKDTSQNIKPYLSKDVYKIHTKIDNGYENFYNEEEHRQYEIIYNGSFGGGTSINLDVSMYRQLKIYYVSNSCTGVFELDLKKQIPVLIDDKYYVASGHSGYYGAANRWEIHVCQVGVNASKNVITNMKQGYFITEGFQDRTGANSNYQIYKIEGLRY